MCNLRQQRGSVLIMVLIVIGMLSVLALHTAYQVKLTSRRIRHHMEKTQALFIAQGVMASVVAAVEQDALAVTGVDHPDEEWLFGYHLNGEPMDRRWRDVEGNVFGEFTLILTDEHSKVNLNYMADTIVRQIIQMVGGVDSTALAEHIRRLRTTGLQDRTIQSLSELMTFEGMSPEIISGEDINLNHQLDDGEDADHDVRWDKGLNNYLTVFTDGTVNINTADEALLAVMPGMTESIAEDLVRRRKRTPFIDLEEVKDIPNVSGMAFKSISSWAEVESRWIGVSVTARARDAVTVKQITAIIDRSQIPAHIRYWREN